MVFSLIGSMVIGLHTSSKCNDLIHNMSLLCQETDQDTLEYIAWRLSFGTHVL